MTAKFTANEIAVLKQAYLSMAGNGFDFGFVNDCRPEGMTAKSAGAVLRGLRKKIQIWSDPEFGQLMAEWNASDNPEYEPDGQPGYNTTFEGWLAAIKEA